MQFHMLELFHPSISWVMDKTNERSPTTSLKLWQCHPISLVISHSTHEIVVWLLRWHCSHFYSISQMVSMALFKVRCWSILLWTVKLEYFHENSRICVASYYKYSTISPLLLLQSFPLPLASRRATVQSLQFAGRISPSCLIYENIKVLCSNFKMESTRKRRPKPWKNIINTISTKYCNKEKKGKKYSALAEPWAKSTVFS